MKPLHAATLDAITLIVSRHYLRPLTLDPVPGDPDRWEIRIKDRKDPLPTEVVHSEGRFTFQSKPARRAPSWDREI